MFNIIDSFRRFSPKIRAVAEQVMAQLIALFSISWLFMYVIQLLDRGYIRDAFPIGESALLALISMVALRSISVSLRYFRFDFRQILLLRRVAREIPFQNIDFFELSKQESDLDADRLALLNKNRALVMIDRRIKSLQVRSSAILFAIGLLLILAALTIVFAGVFVAIDSNVNNDQEKLQRLLSNEQSRESRLIERLSLSKLANSTDEKTAKSAQQQLDNIDRGSFDDPSRAPAAIEQKINESRALQSRINDILVSAWKKSLETERGYGDVKYLIASAIIRIGVVFIIVFLVQVLIGLFRYNTRLATFYVGRRDALQIWSSGSLKDLEVIQKIMTPAIEFGKEPKHPLEEVVREVLAKLPTVNLGSQHTPQHSSSSSSNK